MFRIRGEIMDGNTFEQLDLIAGQSLEQSFQMSAIDAHLAVGVTDPHGVFLYANELFRETSGYSESELIGQSTSILNSGYHPRSFFQEMWRTIKRGETWVGEVRNRRKDGTFYWDKSTIVPFLNEHGRVEKFLNLRTDITAVRNASRKALMNTTFDCLQDEVYIFWPDSFELVYLNQAALAQTKWSMDEVSGKTIFDANAAFEVNHENFHQDKLQVLVQELSLGHRASITYDFVGAGGRTFEAIMQVAQPENEMQRVVVMFKDVTERVNAERAAAQHGLTLDLIKNEVYVFDPISLQFQYVNQAATKKLGWSKSELLSMSPLDLKPSFTETSFRAMIQPLCDGDIDSFNFETIHVDRMGNRYPVEIELEYICNPVEPPKITAIVQDISSREAAEDEIHHLQSSLDLGQDEVYVFWADTLKYIYMNKSARARAGLSDANYCGASPLDHMTEAGVLRFRKRAKPLFDGKSETCEYDVYDKLRGHTLRVSLQLIKPPGQRPRFLAIYRDVTEQRRSQDIIDELKTTLDLLEYEVFVYRPDTLKFVYLNEAALRRMGWSLADIQKKTVRDISPEFNEKRYQRHIAPLLNGDVETIVYETKSELGEDIEITEQLIKKDGEESRIVSVVRNISELKIAEQEISKFKQTLDFSQDLIFMFHPDSLKYTYLNHTAQKLTGWLDDECYNHVVSDNYRDFILEDFRKLTQPLVFGTKSSVISELYGVSGRPYEASFQLVEFEDGSSRFVAVCRDISERKRAEIQKHQFVSTVSHELRTPLTSIKGALSLIEAGAGGDLTPKAKNLVSIAQKNSQRLLLLINDILDIEKLDSGKMVFAMETIDLNAFLAEAVATNAMYGEAFGVSFEFITKTNNAFSNVDPNRLMQVVANLMSNAAKFSHPGDDVIVRLSSIDGRNVISVIDRGIGIPEAEQGRVFERFTQVDSTDTRAKGGTGLGLSISKTIVERMGGDIWIEGVVEIGTTVSFALPKYGERSESSRGTKSRLQ